MGGLLGIAGLLAMAFAGPAAAHAVLESTSPVSGTTLAAAPRFVALTFDEPPQQQFSTIHVTGPDGQRKDSGSRVFRGAVLTVQLVGSAPAGRYVVDWRVVSDDGHPVSGQYSFSVSRTTRLAPPSTGAAVTHVSGGQSSSSSNAGLIAGIVAAVVLIVGNIAWLTLRRRRSAVHE